jgi:hypothetical protein
MTERKIKQNKHGPEYYIQKAVIHYLEDRGWLVERMIGNAFQVGIPDLYAFHPKYGARWIDLKNPLANSLTHAQRVKWPEWESYGLGIWILIAATQSEYDKLFAPPNWREFWKESYNLPSIDEVIDALAKEE